MRGGPRLAHRLGGKDNPKTDRFDRNGDKLPKVGFRTTRRVEKKTIRRGERKIKG